MPWPLGVKGRGEIKPPRGKILGFKLEAKPPILGGPGGAHGLSHGLQGNHGSTQGAITRYASGRTCVPDTERLRWIARDREQLARRLAGEAASPPRQLGRD